MGGGNPPCWFPLITPAVTLEFYSIQQHFIRDVCAKFVIPNSHQSPDIGQNSDSGISDFLISGQSLIKGNCYNSRTSDDSGIKHAPVPKLDKRKKSTSKKIDNGFISENCDVIAVFPIFPDSRRIVCKTYIFIKSNLLSYKRQKLSTRKPLTQL